MNVVNVSLILSRSWNLPRCSRDLGCVAQGLTVEEYLSAALPSAAGGGTGDEYGTTRWPYPYHINTKIPLPGTYSEFAPNPPPFSCGVRLIQV